MPFSLLVAADLYGTKVNLELTLPHLPTVSELTRFTETTFAVESSSVRPSGHPFRSFKVARFQLFDDVSQEWVELGSTGLLTEYCQLYAFQQGVSESQQQIPPPRLPTSNGARSTSPRRVNTFSPPRHPQHDVVPPVAFATSYIASAPMTSRTNTSVSYLDDSPYRAAVASNAHSTERSDNETILSSKQRQFSERQPTTDYKVRTVFDEMDAHHNRRIEADEFGRVLKRLNLDLPSSSVSELFRHADADQDGVLSFADFEHCFGRLYPTLLDSLFYRFREFYEDMRRRDVVERRKVALRGLEADDIAARMQAKDLRRRVEEIESAVMLQEQEVQGKFIMEREYRSKLVEAKRVVESQKVLYQSRGDDAQKAKDIERQRHQSLVDAQRGSEQAQKELLNFEADVARAQEKEAQLEKLLEAARRDTDKKRQQVQLAIEETRKWKDLEQQQAAVLKESAANARRVAEAADVAQAEIDQLLRRVELAEEALLESQKESARAGHRREEEERELEERRKAELEHNRRRLAECSDAIERGKHALEAAEREYAAYRKRRQQVEEQERPLIEKEIHLREERFRLEERENHFRHESKSFQASTGRAAGEGRGA